MSRAAWALAKRQHGVITREQLLELGFSRHAIDHRLRTGRLYVIYRGVYAVGRRHLGRHGEWMAAVLRCGEGAALAGESAAALYGVRAERSRVTEVVVPRASGVKVPGIAVQRRPSLRCEHVTTHRGIPITNLVCTFIDLAARMPPREVEQALTEADSRDLIDPDTVRSDLDDVPRWPGAAKLRTMLDRRTLVLTRSELERRFLPIARRAGLPRPQTRCYVNGFEVDFWWPELGLVVETDGLQYHRTPQQQAEDLRRDQTHTVAELIPLRFTHGQIKYEPAYVQDTLAAVARRLLAAAY